MRDVTDYNGNRITTSKIEIRDILISAVVLSLAFAIMFRNNSIMNYFEYHFGNLKYIGMFLMMFALVALSFIGHEMGHKIVAQKYGMWSEYRMFPLGLVLALGMSLIGFLIAAPGAVMIRGENITQEENARISMAGPMVNIVLSLIGIIGCLALNYTAFVIPFFFLMNMNAQLGLFNLIPFPPLDGSKIIPWRIEVWAALIIMAGLELVLAWFVLPSQFPLYWA